MLARAVAVLVAVMGSNAAAQEIARVDTVPAPILSVLQATPLLAAVSAWPHDYDGDGDADWLVEAAYAVYGGNSATLTYTVFRSDPGGYVIVGNLDLRGGIKRVRMDGGIVTITQYLMVGNDARCCPSGEADIQFRP